MEKQTIEIRKIKEGLFLEREDEVALEQDFEIRLQNGEMIYGSCTPTHMEEMVLGSRYLADDLSDEEKEVLLKKGSAFVQGIFLEYGITIDDEVTEVRNGGFGSTNK